MNVLLVQSNTSLETILVLNVLTSAKNVKTQLITVLNVCKELGEINKIVSAKTDIIRFQKKKTVVDAKNPAKIVKIRLINVHLV